MCQFLQFLHTILCLLWLDLSSIDPSGQLSLLDRFRFGPYHSKFLGGSSVWLNPSGIAAFDLHSVAWFFSNNFLGLFLSVGTLVAFFSQPQLSEFWGRLPKTQEYGSKQEVLREVPS